MSSEVSADSGPLTLPLDDADQTLVMSVANLGFLLERLGEDCDDFQFLRELTQNALEAGATQVVWDVDWDVFELNGTFKLCCIDNGRGMSGQEMLDHINHLSSSSRTQAIDANFGVGAKISAATRNPAGVVYQSWVNGRGAMVQLWRDPDTGQYGLRQFELSGTYTHVVPLGDRAKPPEIDQHGTKVTLLGRDQAHDTMTAPKGALTPSRWVNRILGTRYFRFPQNVSVSAREGWTKPRAERDRNLPRGVIGMGEFLDRYSDSRGTVRLDGCDVHWWILDSSDARKSYSLPNNGHVAALYQDELYELLTGRSGTARLQQFGVIFGSDRVVLYIEPRPDAGQRLMANTARTQLLLDGNSLPYVDWASEFRQQMPQEIQDHMDAVIAGAPDASHQPAIQERLKSYAKLFRLSRHRRVPGGDSRAAGDVGGAGKAEDSGTSSNSPRKRASSKKSNRDPTGDLLASLLAAEGDDAEEVEDVEPSFPSTRWISEHDDPPSRADNELDDRAAKYLAADNLIQINGDFRVFVAMMEHWCAEYDLPQGHDVVKSVVQEWFEQALIETVIGARQLEGDRRWSSDDVDKLLSEEALTAAVLQRYHVANAIKRSLGAKLGTLRDRQGSASAA